MPLGRYLCLPWILSAPLLLCGFVLSVFYIGTDSVLFAPAVVSFLLMAGVSLYPNFKSGWSLPKTATVFSVLAFWLWLFLAQFWSSVPHLSTLFTVLLGVLPALFLILIIAPAPQKFMRIHFYVVGAALLGFALWALIQFFFLFETFGPRIKHPMLDPNNLAGLFEIALLPSLALFLAARQKREAVLWALAMSVFYVALIVTQSRGGFVACAISAVALFGYTVLARPNLWTRILIAIVVAILAPLAINIQFEGVLKTNLMGIAGITEINSYTDRVLLWRSTWEMIKDHFWFGTGLGTFYYYYPSYRYPLDLSDGFFAHTDSLQMWAETGVLSFILFYTVLTCVLLRTIRALCAAQEERLKMKIIGAFCGMLALALHTHLTFHIYLPGISVPLAVLMAYWYVQTDKALGEKAGRIFFLPSQKVFWASSFVAVLVVAIIGGWCVRTAMAIDIMNEVEAGIYTGDKEIARARMIGVKFWAPDNYDRYFEYEARFRIDDLWLNIDLMTPEKARKIYEEALYYLDEAEKRNAPNTRLWDLRARLFEIVDGKLLSNGNDKAIVLLKRVLMANPLAVDSRVELSNIYKRRGEKQTALKVLEEGTIWPAVKGEPDIKFLLAMAALRLELGDKATHDRIMEEAKKRAIRYGMTVK